MEVHIGEFFFDLDFVNRKINKDGIQKVLLQVPDGLRRKVDLFVEALDAEVNIWGGTCYGACDLPLDIGEGELLVHVGHTEIPDLKVDYPVVFVEGRSRDFRPIPDELYHMLRGEIALYSTVQYINQMNRLEDILTKKGYVTRKGEGDGRIKYPGQVLGCNFSARVTDAQTHLYVGTGLFHPIGLALSLKNDVIIFDPVTGTVDTTEGAADRMIRKRFAAIQLAKESDRCGIILSQKPGQRREEAAVEVYDNCPIKCSKLEFDEIEPHLVDSYGWDIMVNTACPRLALDDHIRFETTIVTPIEYLIATGKKGWEEWEMDEIRGI